MGILIDLKRIKSMEFSVYLMEIKVVEHFGHATLLFLVPMSSLYLIDTPPELFFKFYKNNLCRICKYVVYQRNAKKFVESVK